MADSNNNNRGNNTRSSNNSTYNEFEKNLDKMNKLLKNFEKQNSGIMKNIFEIKDVEKSIDSMMNRINKKLDKFYSNQKKRLKEQLGNEYDSYDDIYEKLYKTQSEYQKKLKEETEAQYDDLKKKAEEVAEALKQNSGSTSGNTLNQFSQANNSGSSNSSPNEKDTGKFAKVVSDSIAKTVSSVFGSFIGIFESSVDRLVNVYESTFHDVTTRMNSNQSEYNSIQSSLNDTIQSQYNTVLKTSDAMESLSNVVQLGITDSKTAQETAMQDLVSKTINPYVDVSTDYYKDMQMNYKDSFVNSINGVAESVRETVGQNRITSKSMDELVKLMEPVSMNAKNEAFSRQLPEVAAQLEKLSEQGVPSYIIDDMKSRLYNYINSPLDTLQSGNTADIVTLSNMINKGIDPTENITTSLPELLRSMQTIGIGSGSNWAERNALGNLTGSDIYTNGLNGFNLNDLAETIEDAGNKAADNLDASYKDLYSNFQNGNMTTQKSKEEAYIENMDATQTAAVIKETLPIISDAVQGLLSGGANFLANTASEALGNLAGKGLNKLGEKIFTGGSGGGGLTGVLGSANAGTGIAGGLAKIGSMGTGLTGAGAAALGTTAVTGAIAGTASVIDGIQDIAVESKKAGLTTKEENAKAIEGGFQIASTGIGAAIGTAILPGVGTMIGAGAGALVGMLGGVVGDSLSKGVEINKSTNETIEDMYRAIDSGNEETNAMYEYLTTKYSDYFDGDVESSADMRKKLQEISENTGLTAKELTEDSSEVDYAETINDITEAADRGGNAADTGNELIEMINSETSTESQKQEALKQLLPIFQSYLDDYNKAVESGDTSQIEKSANRLNALGNDLDEDTLVSYFKSIGINNWDEISDTNWTGNGVEGNADTLTGILNNNSTVRPEISEEQKTAIDAGKKSGEQEAALTTIKDFIRENKNSKARYSHLNDIDGYDEFRDALKTRGKEKEFENQWKDYTDKFTVDKETGEYHSFGSGHYTKDWKEAVYYGAEKSPFEYLNVGKFKKGLKTVPKDGFPAILHEGEGVNTKKTNQKLKSYGVDPTDDKSVDKAFNNNNIDSSSIVNAILNMSEQLSKLLNQLIDVNSSSRGTKVEQLLHDSVNKKAVNMERFELLE